MTIVNTGGADTSAIVTPRKPFIGSKKPTEARDKILINPNIKAVREAAVITATATRDAKEQEALQEKATSSGIPLEILEVVYERGIVKWFEQADHTHLAQQYAFSRVSSFIKRGKAWNEDVDLHEDIDRGKMKPEQVIPGQTYVRTAIGGMRGVVQKIFKHPELDYAVHFKAQNGKRYQTSLENLVAEEAPGADAERKRLLILHARLKRIGKTLNKDDRGNVSVRESNDSFFTVRDKKGLVHYIGRDYKEANKIRGRYARSHIHRHHRMGIGREE